MSLRAPLMFLAILALAVAAPVLAPSLAPAPAQAAEASESPTMQALSLGTACPALAFQGPLSPETRKDLGLPRKVKTLALQDLKAPAVILVVYSMYCPHCQREAPVLNALHALIKDRGLDGKIKLVGLGAGNSAFEVSIYRTKYAITFPLFPDPDFTAYKSLGQVGTPFFYTLKRQGEDYVVVGSRMGRLDSPETFLDSVLANAGLAKEN